MPSYKPGNRGPVSLMGETNTGPMALPSGSHAAFWDSVVGGKQGHRTSFARYGFLLSIKPKQSTRHKCQKTTRWIGGWYPWSWWRGQESTVFVTVQWQVFRIIGRRLLQPVIHLTRLLGKAVKVQAGSTCGRYAKAQKWDHSSKNKGRQTSRRIRRVKSLESLPPRWMHTEL